MPPKRRPGPYEPKRLLESIRKRPATSLVERSGPYSLARGRDPCGLTFQSVTNRPRIDEDGPTPVIGTVEGQ